MTLQAQIEEARVAVEIAKRKQLQERIDTAKGQIDELKAKAEEYEEIIADLQPQVTQARNELDHTWRIITMHQRNVDDWTNKLRRETE